MDEPSQLEARPRLGRSHQILRINSFWGKSTPLGTQRTDEGLEPSIQYHSGFEAQDCSCPYYAGVAFLNVA